jgi:membrane protease subunit HflK
MKILDLELILERPARKQTRPPAYLRRAAVAITAVWLLTSVFLVAPDEQAVVTRFGAVVEPRVMPGIHLSLPWPIDRVARLKVQQLQRLVLGGDSPASTPDGTRSLQSQWMTGDQNIINMRVVVQYSVSAPVDYLFQAEDVEQVVGAAVESELARRIAAHDVDTILTIGKAAIQEEVRDASQKRIDDYRTGVLLSTVNIESVTPPLQAVDAFRDVASARADAIRIVNEAQGYANDVIPKARGEARRMTEEAEGYKQKKINEAEGDASRFHQIAAEYSKAAQVTGDRLYAEAMEQILPRIKKIFVDQNGNLDLTIVRRGEAAQGDR